MPYSVNISYHAFSNDFANWYTMEKFSSNKDRYTARKLVDAYINSYVSGMTARIGKIFCNIYICEVSWHGCACDCINPPFRETVMYICCIRAASESEEVVCLQKTPCWFAFWIFGSLCDVSVCEFLLKDTFVFVTHECWFYLGFFDMDPDIILFFFFTSWDSWCSALRD